MTIKHRVIALFMVAAMTIALPACMIHEHVIGKGGDMRQNPRVQGGQLYLIGMRIGDGPGTAITDATNGKSDFTIRTSFNLLGALVGVLTGGFFTMRNVEVYYE
jgi:hypothetical protein